VNDYIEALALIDDVSGIILLLRRLIGLDIAVVRSC
jgi:hypothetical protein